jgi:hypothetical protein
VAAREPAIGQGEQDAENELIQEAFSAQGTAGGSSDHRDHRRRQLHNA